MSNATRQAYISNAVDAISALVAADPVGTGLRAQIKQNLGMLPSTFIDLDNGGAFAFTPLAYEYVRSQGFTLADDGGPPGGHHAYINAAIDAISALTDASLKAEIKKQLGMMPSTYLDLETGAYKFTPLAYTFVASFGYTLADDGGPIKGNRQAEFSGHRLVVV